jgi:2-polyprenyl-3-methyl-5-hydroxy-6-metoxy-1,4-benzoquinol methylase
LDKQQKREWEKALLLPGESDMRDSLAKELSEYAGLSLKQIEDLNAVRLKNASVAWHKESRDTEKKIEAFYDEFFNYILEEISLDEPFRRVQSCTKILNWLEGHNELYLLDYGSGIGNMALFYCANGFNVTVADVSTPLLDFCRWRFDRRGWSVTVIDLKKQNLPADAYNEIICMDVMEHLYDPWKHLKKLSKALKPNGLLFIEGLFGSDIDRPMHIVKDSRVLDLSPILGLATINCSPYRITNQPNLLVFQAQRRLHLSHYLSILMGLIRYGLKFVKNGSGKFV